MRHNTGFRLASGGLALMMAICQSLVYAHSETGPRGTPSAGHAGEVDADHEDPGDGSNPQSESQPPATPRLGAGFTGWKDWIGINSPRSGKSKQQSSAGPEDATGKGLGPQGPVGPQKKIAKQGSVPQLKTAPQAPMTGSAGAKVLGSKGGPPGQTPTTAGQSPKASPQKNKQTPEGVIIPKVADENDSSAPRGRTYRAGMPQYYDTPSADQGQNKSPDGKQSGPAGSAKKSTKSDAKPKAAPPAAEDDPDDFGPVQSNPGKRWADEDIQN